MRGRERGNRSFFWCSEPRYLKGPEAKHLRILQQKQKRQRCVKKYRQFNLGSTFLVKKKMAGKKFGTFTSNAFSDVIGSKLSPSSNEVSHRAAFFVLEDSFRSGREKNCSVLEIVLVPRFWSSCSRDWEPEQKDWLAHLIKRDH